MFQNVQSGKLKITQNVIQQWEGTRVPRVSNMKEVINPQPERDQILQSTERSLNNSGTRKDSDLYISY